MWFAWLDCSSFTFHCQDENRINRQSLDETIDAIYEIGLSLPLELRCTFGGLGKTKTAREILKRSDAHFPGEEAR